MMTNYKKYSRKYVKLQEVLDPVAMQPTDRWTLHSVHCTALRCALRTAHCTALHCIPPSHYPQFNWTDASPRTAEIAAYFTHCNLQPVHQVRWTGVGPCDYINPCSRFHLTAGAAPVELGTKLEDVPTDLRASMSCKGPNKYYPPVSYMYLRPVVSPDGC